MSTSVVVVSFRLHEWLAPCITSVTNEADEVVVVDNGSADGAVGQLAREAGARVVTLATNTGFPSGANAGMAAARGDVVALLNDDAMAQPGWLAAAAAILDDPAVAAVGPKLVFAHPFAEVCFDDDPWFAPGDQRALGRQIKSVTVNGREVLDGVMGPGIHRLEGDPTGTADRWRWTAGRVPLYVPLGPEADASGVRINGEPAPVTRITDVVNSVGLFLTTDGYAGDQGSGFADDGQFDESADRFGGCGGALVFQADTYARVGPLAGSFFSYYEDVDWCWRAQLMGLRIRYDARSVVRHVGGVSTGGLTSPAMQRRYVRNRLSCLVRNAPANIARAEVMATLKDPPPGVSRWFLGSPLPQAMAQRRRLAQGWIRTPEGVWDQWAGVGDTREGIGT